MIRPKTPEFKNFIRLGRIPLNFRRRFLRIFLEKIRYFEI